MSNLIQNFSEFQFSSPINAALETLQFKNPTPIQQQTIPALIEGKDVLGLAQTGTGKTAAFSLPLIQKLINANTHNYHQPKALIITPTRELALQVEQHVIALTANLPKISTIALCGGQSYTPQIRQLKKGCAIVVGTPGRIIDHIKQGTLLLNQIEYFVLDEADEMLRMGFVEDVESIMEHMPSTRQTALFSATMPPRVRQLVNRYLNNPVIVEIQAEKLLMPKIQQFFLFASMAQKTDALVKILRIAEEGAKIVFVRTKQQTEALAEVLVNAGIRAIALNGDLAQAMRERLIQQFRRGGADVLVATDIAARGLDVSQVTQVINFDVPGDPETYVHRIGRTGRAGRTGQSILFVEPKQSRFLNIIERHTQQKIQKMMVPTDAYIQMLEQQQFLQKITAEMQNAPSSDYAEALEELVNQHDYNWKDLAVSLVKMHLGNSRWVAKAESPYDVPASNNDRETYQNPKGRERRRERNPRQDRGFSGNARRADQVLYRIAVGKSHGVRPGQIIGALANEGGISGSQINGLKIYENHATVLLPDGLARNVVDNLKKAWVCGRQLQLKIHAEMM